MKNILFLTTRFPYPPDDGGKIDTLSNIRLLCKNYNVILFYFGQKSSDEKTILKKTPIKKIFNFTINLNNNPIGLMKNVFSKCPYTIKKYQSFVAYKSIKKIITNFNIERVFIDHLHLSFYGELIKRNFSQVKIFLREHNVEYILWQRMANEEKIFYKKIVYKWQAKKILNYEKEKIGYFDACIAISYEDKNKLQKLNPRAKLYVIPTVLNIEEYDFSQYKKIKIEPYSLIYVGNYSWPPNVNGILWFLENVWPKVKKDFPEAKLFIVGKNPTSSILKYKNNNGIIITGYVDDVKKWIAKSEIFVVPLFFGGGIRIKILEAMATGKPIISTSIGAEGINCENMKNIIITDTKEGFIKNIKLLFNQKRIEEKLSINAQELIKERYSFEKITSDLSKIIDG